MARNTDLGPGARTIVVINDSPELLELAEMLLREENYEVKVSVAGTGSLELIRGADAALVVLDIRLPDISGWQILQELKADPATASIPVLVCSAAVEQLRALADQLLEMGVDTLIKPFSIDIFLEKVNACIERAERG